MLVGFALRCHHRPHFADEGTLNQSTLNIFQHNESALNDSALWVRAGQRRNRTPHRPAPRRARTQTTAMSTAARASCVHARRRRAPVPPMSREHQQPTYHAPDIKSVYEQALERLADGHDPREHPGPAITFHRRT